MQAKRHVVKQRVFAMSHCRSAQIEGFANKPSDRATSRQRVKHQRAVCRASLETGRQCDIITLGCVVTIETQCAKCTKSAAIFFELYGSILYLDKIVYQDNGLK
jgi:hypothetical protein